MSLFDNRCEKACMKCVVQTLKKKANQLLLKEEMREITARTMPDGPEIAHDSAEQMTEDARAWRAFKREEDDDDDGLKCVESAEQPPMPHDAEESVPTSCPWSCCAVGGRDVRRGRRGGLNLRSDYRSKLPFAELRNVKESDDRMFDFELLEALGSDESWPTITDEPGRGGSDHDATRQPPEAKSPDVGRTEVSEKEKAIAAMDAQLGAGGSMIKRMRMIAPLTRVKEDAVIGGISGEPIQWLHVPITIDSGAAESVIPLNAIMGYAVKAPEKDEWFQCANGNRIKNEGEQRIPIVTNSGTHQSMTFQACEVTKPLGSVQRMIEQGHAIVFAPPERGGSFILNLHTWAVEPLREDDGNFVLDTWVPPPSVAAKAGFVRQA